MPHPMSYVPDVAGHDAPVLFRQGSSKTVLRGFLITVENASQTKRTQAGDEMVTVLQERYGTGPAFSKREIEKCPGVEFVSVGVEADNYNPVTLAHGVLSELARGSTAYNQGKPRAGDVVRLLPVETSSDEVDSMEQLLEFIRPLINHHFKEGGQGVFGVHVEEHTPSPSLGSHEAVAKAVGDLVPSSYKVDLSHADKTILVVKAGNLCTAAVVPDWHKLHHYNVQALTTEKPSQIV